MAFIPSRRKRHDTASKEGLNLTSMMDMMTIILLFLLKTYSTSGQIVTPSQDLKLPYSLSQEEPHKELNISITRDDILVGSQKVISINALNSDGVLIQPLFNVLKKYSSDAKQNEIKYGVKFSHQVIIQGDENTPFELIFKVLYTCGQSEYNKLRLLTYREK